MPSPLSLGDIWSSLETMASAGEKGATASRAQRPGMLINTLRIQGCLPGQGVTCPQKSIERRLRNSFEFKAIEAKGG